MAQRFKATDLKEMIRALVREEIREVVVSTINEVLTERYLRKLAESAVSARPRGVAALDIQGDDEEPDEEVPHSLANSILGVGQENPVYKKVSEDDHVRQFGEGTNNKIMSLLFEGTKPLRQREKEAGVPVLEDEPEFEAKEQAQSKDMNEQKEIWKTLVQGMEKAAESKRPMLSQEAEEARIKRMREELNRKP